MPHKKHTTPPRPLWRSVCLAVIALAFCAAVTVEPASAWFTDTQTVQVAAIQAKDKFPVRQSDADEQIAEEDAMPIVADAPEADTDAAQSSDTQATPAPEVTATPTPAPTATPTPTPAETEQPTATPAQTAVPTPAPAESEAESKVESEPEQSETPAPAESPKPTESADIPGTAETDPDAGDSTDEATDAPTVEEEEPQAEPAPISDVEASADAAPVAFTAVPRTRMPHRAPKSTATLELYRANPQEEQAFNLPNLLPGDSAAKDFAVVVSYTGHVTLHFSAAADSDNGHLAQVLQISVTCDDATLYSGTLADMPSSLPVELPNAARATAETRNFRITVTLPTAAGNEYQDKTLLAHLKWWVQEYPAADTDADNTNTGTGTDNGGQLTSLPISPATGKPDFAAALRRLPQTADEFPLTAVVLVMLCAAGGLAVLTVAKRKGDKHDRK